MAEDKQQMVIGLDMRTESAAETQHVVNTLVAVKSLLRALSHKKDMPLEFGWEVTTNERGAVLKVDLKDG